MSLTKCTGFTLKTLEQTQILEKGALIITGRLAPEVFREKLSSYLTHSEQERLSRFRNIIQQNIYLSAHAVLNLVLGSFTGHSPSHLQFTFGTERKPYLLPVEAGLYFNLSHSGEYFLIGLMQNREIGVDVEVHRKGIAREILAKRFFHAHEQVQLDKAAVSFFDIWARKEAFLKAQGTGLAFPTASFDATQGSIQVNLRSFFLKSLSLFPGASAAVAVEGEVMPFLQVYRLYSEPDWKAFLKEA